MRYCCQRPCLKKVDESLDFGRRDLWQGPCLPEAEVLALSATHGLTFWS